MSAPLPVHEERVRVLRDLAELSGLVVGDRLAPFLTPDLVAYDGQGALALVADAKATEYPGDPHTKARLLRYADAARISVRRQERGLRLAICHGRGVPEWRDTLRRVAAAARLVVVGEGRTTVGGDAVSWVDVRGWPRRATTPSVSSRHDAGPEGIEEAARRRLVLRGGGTVVGPTRRGV